MNVIGCILKVYFVEIDESSSLHVNPFHKLRCLDVSTDLPQSTVGGLMLEASILTKTVQLMVPAITSESHQFEPSAKALLE